MIQRQHGWWVSGGTIGVRLEALSGWHTGGIARVEIPEGDDLAAAGDDLADQVVVFAVRGPHERRVDADYADERIVNAGPIAAISTIGKKMTDERERGVHFLGNTPQGEAVQVWV